MMRTRSEVPKLCVCIGHSDLAQAEAVAMASCERGERLLELRIDMLSEPRSGADMIRRIRNSYPEVTVLATCRLAENGGGLRGSINGQLEILQDAVDAGAGLVDVEIETIEQAPGCLRPFGLNALTLASYHNFDETPSLQPVMQRLARTGADIYKVATTVQRPTDNLRLLDLCGQHPNMVVAGMGETGTLTRSVSPSRGGLFSYVAPDPHDWNATEGAVKIESLPTAPGQISASLARKLFRVERGNPDTKVYAVIAKPVGHSKSPLIHNRAFLATGYDGIYVPMLVEPGHIDDFFRAMRQLPLSGISVTIPHKQSVIPYLDLVEPAARGIGAVNTIYWEAGQLVGANTDAIGITAPLSKRIALKGTRALVVGNGGAAKAAVVALNQEGSEIVVTGRNPERVNALAQLHSVDAIEFSQLRDESFDILVQATSVGMLPNVDGNLFPGRIPADIVFDLVYNPLETALLRHAASQKKVVISGIEMFIEQAAAQFRIWTGLEAPRRVMRDAVRERTVE